MISSDFLLGLFSISKIPGRSRKFESLEEEKEEKKREEVE